MVFFRHQAQPLRNNEDGAAYYQFEQFPGVFTEEGFLLCLFAFRNRGVVRPFHDGHAVFHFIGNSLQFGGEAVVAAGRDPELAGSIHQHRILHFRHGFDGVLYFSRAGRAVQALHIIGTVFRSRAELFFFGNGHALFRFIGSRLHQRQKTVIAAGADPELAGFINQHRFIYNGNSGDRVLHFHGTGCAIQAIYFIGTVFFLGHSADPFRNGDAVFRFGRSRLHFGQQVVIIIGGDTQLPGLVDQRGIFHAGNGGNGVLHFNGAGRAVQAVHFVGTELFGFLRAFFPGHYGYIGQEGTADFLEHRQHGVGVLGGNPELFGNVADCGVGYARQGFNLMLNFCGANGAVQIDQAVNPLHVVGVRHTAFAVGQAFAAVIAVLFMGIAGRTFAIVRMTGQMRFMCIGRVVVYKFMLVVVVGSAIIAAATSMVVVVLVVVTVFVIMIV